jgi:DNA-binding protein HU-beta
MNKADLVDQIAASAAVSKTTAAAIIETFTGSVSSALKKRQRVTLVGFGTFAISHHKARNGRNPHTGSLIKIPAQHVPRFSPGSELRQAVNYK